MREIRDAIPSWCRRVPAPGLLIVPESRLWHAVTIAGPHRRHGGTLTPAGGTEDGDRVGRYAFAVSALSPGSPVRIPIGVPNDLHRPAERKPRPRDVSPVLRHRPGTLPLHSGPRRTQARRRADW